MAVPRNDAGPGALAPAAHPADAGAAAAASAHAGGEHGLTTPQASLGGACLSCTTAEAYGQQAGAALPGCGGTPASRRASAADGDPFRTPPWPLPSSAQVEQLRATYGYNEVKAKQVGCPAAACMRAARGGKPPPSASAGCAPPAAQPSPAPTAFPSARFSQTPEWKNIAWRYLDWVSLVIIAAAIVSASVTNDGDRGWTSFTLLVRPPRPSAA